MTTTSLTSKAIGPNGLPTKGSNLTEQIYLALTDRFFPASGTMGDFWKKRVLLEFIQNSGMPLARKTIIEASELRYTDERGQPCDRWVDYALTNLEAEGYIRKQANTMASFLFQGNDGDSYELVMDADDAEEKAKEAQVADQIANATASQVAQSDPKTAS